MNVRERLEGRLRGAKLMERELLTLLTDETLRLEGCRGYMRGIQQALDLLQEEARAS